MNKRRPHRSRRVNLTRPGASSVTVLPGMAAAAAFLPGLGGHTAPLPAQAAPDTQAADTAVIHQAAARNVITARAHADAAMPAYTVRAGDNLSTIAYDHCDHQADRWTGIYAASHLHGSANEIQPGEKLELSCTYDPSLLGRASSITPVHARTTAVATVSVSTGRGSDQDACTPHCPWGDGDEDGMDLDHSPFASAPSAAPVTVHRVIPAGSVQPTSSFQACVIARESGGNSQVMNSSGHYGLYQFSASTWQAYGGSAADFGHASAAEQTRIFDNAMAQGGQSNWSPYDGC